MHPTNNIGHVRKEVSDKFVESDELKIYEWNPSGHGEYTFVVIDTSLAKAKQRVDAEVVALRGSGDWSNSYACNGWDTDYYELSIRRLDDVLSFANE